ncbi:MAG: hypothetical protein KAI81_02965, partial [Candidatus Marinimicrobia bacterium]|nr:hypothetical protein [Candidatus Neomarinimicrobiota bacterium]
RALFFAAVFLRFCCGFSVFDRIPDGVRTDSVGLWLCLCLCLALSAFPTFASKVKNKFIVF